jgi:hypothetical protein
VLLLGEEGKSQSKKARESPHHEKTPALPFIKQGEQVTLVKKEKSKRLCMHNNGKEGGLFPCSGSHCPWFLLAVVAMCDCP